MVPVRFQREWLLLVGSLLIVGALYNHYLGHSVYLVELIFIAVGSLMALYSLKGLAKNSPTKNDGLLVVFLSRWLAKEQIAALLPLLGFLVIVSWSGWKLFITKETNLRMEDFIVTLFGLSLVLYYSGPSRFSTQKDFAVLYLMFLTIVFAVIWKTYTLITGESYYRVTAYSEYYFITIPVVSLARLLGIHADAQLNLSGFGLSNTIAYDYHGHYILLGIGSGCSGLYSAGLFFSAFLAFVLVRYRKVNPRILVALGAGLLLTWFSNIIRMVVTVATGAMWGHPALVFVHSYIGILIFLAFITIFWFIIVRWLDRFETSTAPPIASAVSAGADESGA